MPKHNEVVAQLLSFVSRYVEAHGREARGARAELDQLGTLLADAVSRLTSSFEKIGTLSTRQQLEFAIMSGPCSCDAAYLRPQPAANDCACGGTVTVTVPAPAPGAPDEGQRYLGTLAANIERSVNEAVTALQFHDIASQLLGHAARRIELLERMAGQLERLPDASIEELSEDLAHACAALGSNPVGQARMTSGAVELF